MVDIRIAEEACRGCRMCLEICPTQVFEFDEEKSRARIVAAQDCIACFSCAALCPSAAIALSNCHLVKNFYRNLDFSRRMEKFL